MCRILFGIFSFFETVVLEGVVFEKNVKNWKVSQVSTPKMEVQGVGLVHSHHIFYSSSFTHFSYKTIYGNSFLFNAAVLYFPQLYVGLVDPKDEVNAKAKFTAYLVWIFFSVPNPVEFNIFKLEWVLSMSGFSPSFRLSDCWRNFPYIVFLLRQNVKRSLFLFVFGLRIIEIRSPDSLEQSLLKNLVGSTTKLLSRALHVALVWQRSYRIMQ